MNGFSEAVAPLQRAAQGKDVGKRFATLQARAALAGVILAAIEDDAGRPAYVVTRWALTRPARQPRCRRALAQPAHGGRRVITAEDLQDPDEDGDAARARFDVLEAKARDAGHELRRTASGFVLRRGTASRHAQDLEAVAALLNPSAGKGALR